MESIKAPIIEKVKHAKIAAGNPYPQAQQVILEDIAKPGSEVI